MTAAKKRKRSSDDSAADLDGARQQPARSTDLIAAELRALIAAAVRALALSCLLDNARLHELLVDSSESTKKNKKSAPAPAPLLKLKAEARVQPGAYSSDLAIKLFYKFVKPASSSDRGDERLATPEAFAAALVGAMQHELSTTDDHGAYRHVLGVLLPDAEAVESHGLRRDRILIHTREFAQLAIDSEEKSTSDELAELAFLYRDDAIAVVDKPTNVLSVDGNNSSKISIQRRIQRLYPEARMVHRLDLETSGILVIALTRTAAQHLNAQFRTRVVQKSYFALVCGRVDSDSGTIELAMGPHPTEQLVQIVHEPGEYDSASSRWTRTEWRVVERTPEGDSLMELKPITGKTHQLRVHMQHLGHPILGDSLYARELVQHKAPRLCLHAAKIELRHPVTNELLTIESQCPF